MGAAAIVFTIATINLRRCINDPRRPRRKNYGGHDLMESGIREVNADWDNFRNWPVSTVRRAALIRLKLRDKQTFP